MLENWKQEKNKYFFTLQAEKLFEGLSEN